MDELRFRNSLIAVAPAAFVDVPFVSVLPRLLEAVGADKLLCAQTIGRSRYRLTFVNSVVCDAVFNSVLSVDGFLIFVISLVLLVLFRLFVAVIIRISRLFFLVLVSLIC